MSFQNFPAQPLTDVEAGGVVTIGAGDLVRFSEQSNSSWHGMLTGADVDVTGVNMAVLVVATVPNMSPDGRQMIGSSQFDVILQAGVTPGEATVTVVPQHADGRKGGASSFQVTIEPQP